MNTQEAYELMRVYLTREGARRAVDPFESCMYETVMNGVVHRCAVGCLLTPSTLAQTIGEDETDDLCALRDFSGTIEAVMAQDFQLPELTDVDPSFLDYAQQIHDEAANWDGGVFKVSELDEVARAFGLRVVKDDARVTEPQPLLTPA